MNYAWGGGGTITADFADGPGWGPGKGIGDGFTRSGARAGQEGRLARSREAAKGAKGKGRQNAHKILAGATEFLTRSGARGGRRGLQSRRYARLWTIGSCRRSGGEAGALASIGEGVNHAGLDAVRQAFGKALGPCAEQHRVEDWREQNRPVLNDADQDIRFPEPVEANCFNAFGVTGDFVCL